METNTSKLDHNTENEQNSQRSPTVLSPSAELSSDPKFFPTASVSPFFHARAACTMQGKRKYELTNPTNRLTGKRKSSKLKIKRNDSKHANLQQINESEDAESQFDTLKARAN